MPEPVRDNTPLPFPTPYVCAACNGPAGSTYVHVTGTSEVICWGCWCKEACDTVEAKFYALEFEDLEDL